jgi:hypothetical protein
MRQELRAEHGIAMSLRTVERAVAPLRRELAAEARATLRFETAPGKQMQVNFGEKRVVIGGETITGLPVRRCARPLASSARARVPARAPGVLVRRA